MSSQKQKVSATASPYPYAAAPDIIRAHQKDAYFSGVLTNQLTDLHRRFLGARSAHAWSGNARTTAELVYLALTTLIGNRTLGEEYCDLVQVEASEPAPLSILSGGPKRSSSDDGNHGRGIPGPRLPSITRRAAYITLSILVPHLFSRFMPTIRAALRRRLEARLQTLAARAGRKAQASNKGKAGEPPKLPVEAHIERYILAHLPALTSGGPWQAAALAAFYFGGAYYGLAKRIVGLRYVFTRDITAGGTQNNRAGYEVLGVLLVVQFTVQAYINARSLLAATAHTSASSQPRIEQDEENEATLEADAEDGFALREPHRHPHTFGVEVSLDHAHSYTANNFILLPGDDQNQGPTATIDISRATHTPVMPRGGARYDLANPKVMCWIKGEQQRRCTLCLEGLRDPSATPCGHVFCWSCIGDWVREKPECPLCRREALVQHILPLRAPIAA